ncbi:MAG: radical SAM protein [Mesosutterella sp.]|nr:radical SAM protein [Mesosutterella sp.]
MLSEMDIVKVYVMLGSACDFHCRHCLQHDLHPRLSKRPSPRLISYLQYLADLRPRGIARMPEDVQVVFFGGEPLLYLPQMREIMERVERTNVRWSVVTNGSRLTDALIDELNEGHVHVALSNDGPDTAKVRDVNLLDDPGFCARFRRLESRSICATLHAYSQDLYRDWEYFDSRVGLDTPVAFDRLVLNWNMPKDIYDYDFPAWRRTCAQVVDALVEAWESSNDPLDDMREAEFLAPYVRNASLALRGNALFPACGACRKTANVDLDGNMWLCHNGFGRFERCDSDGAKVAEEARVRFGELRAGHGKPCKDCVALPICLEGCPFSGRSDAQARQCAFMRILGEQVRRFMATVAAYQTTEVDL